VGTVVRLTAAARRGDNSTFKTSKNQSDRRIVASYYIVSGRDRKETYLRYFTGIVEFHEKDYFNRE
jgi:hypothetical protein